MIAYALQITCLTVAAELVLRLARVHAPGFRYAYWRAALAASLLLPWLLRLAPNTAPGRTEPSSIVLAPLAAVADVVPRASSLEQVPTFAVLVWIVGVGAAIRMGWVCIGLLRLARYRRRGSPVADSIYDEIQRLLGTDAEIRAAADLPQPVAIGFRRPIVLLPDSLAAAPEAVRRAVVTHELVHVVRRDWLWVIGEEALRAAFWFHPAVWFSTARVRQTREEFTDHVAVLATGNRRVYIEALLQFADAPLDPAPAFARRAHLFHRIVLLSRKESVMSSHRVVCSGLLVTCLLAASAWYANQAFPIAAELAPAAQAGEPALHPITPENPIPRRLFATPILYPLTLQGTGLESAVSVRVVLNGSGGVAAATRGAVALSRARAAVSIDEQQAMETFAEAAADAIRQWQYAPPARAPIAFYVAAVFKPGAAATVAQSEEPQAVRSGPEGVSIGAASEMMRKLEEARARLEALHARTELEAARAPGASAGVPPLRVGGGVPPPTRTRMVAPAYPPIAKSARVQGVVIVEATIDAAGRVADARVLRSIPLLDQAALDAVRQWEFAPTMLNGVAVPVVITVTLPFRLEEGDRPSN